MKFKLFFLFFLILNTYYLILNTPIFGQHFVSPSYIIDWGNFNITSGKKSSTNYSLTDTVGQNAPGPYSATGYKVKAGFQYIYETLYQFNFAIDNLDIPLGTLVPGVASTATNIIAVSSPAGHGYQIMAHENRPLSTMTGITIPDTSCNIGSTCTDSSSNIWTNNTDYGFGFNAVGINTSGAVTGIGTSNYFTDITYFRPFANYAIASKTNQIFMSEDLPSRYRLARITYKAIIPVSQSAGNYQNSVIFTAIPKY